MWQRESVFSSKFPASCAAPTQAFSLRGSGAVWGSRHSGVGEVQREGERAKGEGPAASVGDAGGMDDAIALGPKGRGRSRDPGGLSSRQVERA